MTYITLMTLDKNGGVDDLYMLASKDTAEAMATKALSEGKEVRLFASKELTYAVQTKVVLDNLTD